MVAFTVMFQTEAATLEEAEAAVGEWVVTPGTMLISIVGSVMSSNAPVDLSDGGAVSTGKVSLPTQPGEQPQETVPEPDA